MSKELLQLLMDQQDRLEDQRKQSSASHASQAAEQALKAPYVKSKWVLTSSYTM
jgi:hypothetical protein